MTLYRMACNDGYSIWQAQYALSVHQEEVKKEPWFLAYVFENLARQIIDKLEELDDWLIVRNLEWRGWTEVWTFDGEMDWSVDEQILTSE